MLTALIICMKVLIAGLYGYVIFTIIQAKSADRTIEIRLDLLSDIEVCFVTGLSLVSVFSRISDSTLVFTACLCAIALILAFFQSRRLIFAGNEKVYLRNKVCDQKKLISIQPEKLVFLKIQMKSRDERIYFPLTDHNALQKIQDNLKRKNRKKSH